MSRDRSLIPVRLEPADANGLHDDAWSSCDFRSGGGADAWPSAQEVGESRTQEENTEATWTKSGLHVAPLAIKAKETHDKLVKGATSYVGSEMRKHEELQHNLKCVS